VDRIYVRQANITFSQSFVDTLRSNGVIITRRDRYNRSGILVNHGNGKPITVNPKVRNFYIINQPDSIRLCSNKVSNCNLLDEFYPEMYQSVEDVDKFPVMVKPINGHHGYGIKKIDNRSELEEFFRIHNLSKYIIQEYIDIKHEYRFNVLDRKVYQVSHKERQEGLTDEGGFIFVYRSLGKDAKISQKFWDYINNVIDAFHNEVGYDLGHYGIDVIKGKDGKYYLSEINSACGLGQFTLGKLLEKLKEKYNNGDLENYRVRTRNENNYRRL